MKSWGYLSLSLSSLLVCCSVKYLSSFSAALFLVDLQGTGAFSFASDAEVSPELVWGLVFIQLLPELPIDFFLTFIEYLGGLSRVHDANWNLRTGVRKDESRVCMALGDLVKGVTVKIVMAPMVCCFVLMFCTK